MSDNLPTQQQGSDEVDLGQLFKLIGKAFDRFYRFIKSIFVGLFHLLMSLLLFIQKHLIKLAIAGVLGLGLGYFFDTKTDTVYESQMVVEPNFNSVQQLYNNISYYNELAKANDSLTLSSTFKISAKKASSIKEIVVDAYSDENQKIKLFDEFVTKLDTTTRKTINYESYLENFNTFDARFHKITFIATNPRVAKNIQETIINSITNNKYFENQQLASQENIDLQDSFYKKQLKEIDTLQHFYKKLALKTAEKETATTSISLADKDSSDNKELALIEKVDEIKQQQVALNIERARKQNVINVISDFPNLGVKSGGLLKSNKVLFFVGAVGLAFLILILLELNSYLKKYQQKRNS